MGAVAGAWSILCSQVCSTGVEIHKVAQMKVLGVVLTYMYLRMSSRGIASPLLDCGV